MTDEQIKRILDDNYEPHREDLIVSMMKDFFSKKMLSTAVLVWFWGLLFMVGAVLSAVAFFRTDLGRSQLMYATIFTCCLVFVAFMKVFAWQMIHRNGIIREIKRLELRISELAKSVAEKP